MKSWVQLEQVEVDLKNTEEVQRKLASSTELGPKKAILRATERWGRDKVKCDECGKSVSKAHLRNHKRVVHRGEVLLFRCLVGDCGTRFVNNRALCDHKRVNHGYPKLKCKFEGCGSEFLLQHKFDTHRRTHEGKTECDECGNKMHPSYIVTHKKIVHRGETFFSCHIIGCDKKFTENSRKATHLRAVHGFPKLQCKFKDCSAEFLSARGLKKHNKKHSK